MTIEMILGQLIYFPLNYIQIYVSAIGSFEIFVVAVNVLLAESSSGFICLFGPRI